MFLHQTCNAGALPSKNIVLQVVAFYVKRCEVARLADVADIILVRNVSLVGEQPERVHHLGTESFIKQVVESIGGVLHHIVQETHDLFVFGFPCQANG